MTRKHRFYAAVPIVLGSAIVFALASAPGPSQLHYFGGHLLLDLALVGLALLPKSSSGKAPPIL